MNRKRLEERRRRVLALGRADAQHRCAFCKRQRVKPLWAPYCSEACQLDAKDRDEVRSR